MDRHVPGDSVNGIPKILYWIMGALLAISMAGAGATASWMQSRIITLEASQAITEARSRVSEARVEMLERSLIRIEVKLDRALEERRH